MAINADALTSRYMPAAQNPRLADRRLFLIAAIAFPLLVLIGYSRTYYFGAFFNARPLANSLVHAHALVMSTWVVYFTAQTVLIRTKNVKLHMTLGMVGIALAALVVIVGMAAAYDAHLVRKTAPPGLDPFAFFAVPVFDMVTFIILFSAAIYYRRRPAEHKALMLLTAINFLPAAIARIPLLPPQFMIMQAYAIPDVMALLCFGWYSWKHRSFNKAFAIGIALIIVSQALRIWVSGTDAWLGLVAMIAS
jgi:hypothetical protein